MENSNNKIITEHMEYRPSGYGPSYSKFNYDGSCSRSNGKEIRHFDKDGREIKLIFNFDKDKNTKIE
jgi:hypothetical protein